MLKRLISRARRQGRDELESSITTNQPYEYRPLKEGFIRLLILEPSKDPKTPLSLKQVEKLLTQDLEYFALSYSWDAQQTSCLVNCEGRALYITPNCEAAMRKIRGIEERERVLWIDSICINQKDLDERNAQVKMMGDIYKSASSVIIWLGEGNSDTDCALELLTMVNNCCERDSPFNQMILDKINLDLEKALNVILERQERGTDQLMELFKRSWFHRMWTVQESVLPNADNCSILCGNQTIEWQKLFAGVRELAMEGYTEESVSDAIRLQIYLSSTISIRRKSGMPLQDALKWKFEGRTAAFELSRLLWLARIKNASDPKDKVFALYGIAMELGIQTPVPDYRKTTEEIYREWAEACIVQDKSLRVLYYVSTPTRLASLPSWVPDWSQRNAHESEANSGEGDKSLSNASGGSPPWFSFSTGLERRLILRARFEDRVELCTQRDADTDRFIKNQGWTQFAKSDSEREERNHKYSKLSTLLKPWVVVAENSNIPAGDDLMDALELVLQQGRRSGSTMLHGPQDPATNVVQALEDFLAIAINPQSPAASSSPFMTPKALEHASNFFTPDLRRFYSARPWLRPLQALDALISALYYERTLFVTRDGRLGTAPNCICPKDIVALIAGLDMPFILREAGEYYQIIAPAYVHGMMAGEFWPDGANVFLVNHLDKGLSGNEYSLQEIEIV